MNGTRLSPEPVPRQFDLFGSSVANFISCTVFAICHFGSDMGFVEREGSASNLLHLALAMAMAAFTVFSGRFSDLLMSGLKGIVFARKMHSTTKFAMTVLSKCVCVELLNRSKTSTVSSFSAFPF